MCVTYTVIIICTEIVICALFVVFSTIVLRVHDHPPLNPIPHWTKRLFLKKVARWLSVKVNEECLEDDPIFTDQSLSGDCASVSNIQLLNYSHSKGEQLNRRNGDEIKSANDAVREYMALKRWQMCEEMRRTLYEGQWRDLARVLDALFLIFCTFVLFITHLILYLHLYGYLNRQPPEYEDDTYLIFLI
jgi:hypothetical protein